MPLDYRRNNGPEKCVSYKLYTKEYKKSIEELHKELLDENGLRRDGRSLEEARTVSNLFATTEAISQAQGSSYIELNRTKVACSVFQPTEVPRQNDCKQLGELFVEVRFSPFSCPRKRRPYVVDEEGKILSAALKKALEPLVCRQTFPNMKVDIFVLILEHDGGCLAAAINAAGLALADAVIPMFDIITACSVAVIEDRIYVDPTEAEEYLALTPMTKTGNHGLVTMAMLHELKQVADMRQIGSMDVDCIMKIMGILENECTKIVPIIQTILARDVLKHSEIRKEEDKEFKESEAVLKATIEEMKKAIKP